MHKTRGYYHHYHHHHLPSANVAPPLVLFQGDTVPIDPRRNPERVSCWMITDRRTIVYTSHTARLNHPNTPRDRKKSAPSNHTCISIEDIGLVDNNNNNNSSSSSSSSSNKFPGPRTSRCNIRRYSDGSVLQIPLRLFTYRS